MRINFLSNLSIPGGFKHLSILSTITAHHFLDPYVHTFLVQQGWDNEYSRIIVNGLLALILYLVIEFVTDVLMTQDIAPSPFSESDDHKDRIQSFKEFVLFFTISEFILIGILCFMIYNDMNAPLLKSWGITGAIGVSYLLSQWYQSNKTQKIVTKSSKKKDHKKQGINTNGSQYISFKKADKQYDISQLIKNHNVDDIDREYEKDDMFVVYRGDTTIQQINWEENTFSFSGKDCKGIIVDGNLTISKGMKNQEHMNKFLYVTGDLKASYIINFDTLIHIDGDLFISDYLYADSFFGYIQCLGQVYTPYLINNGQHIEAQQIYSDKLIDVSDFSPTHPLYTYGLKDVVQEVLKNINYKKNEAEIDEEKLLEYMKKGKSILR